MDMSNANVTDTVMRLLNEAEAAKLLGISARTLWTMRNGGQIPAVKIGQRVLYDPKDLRDFINRNKTLARSPACVVG